MKSVVRHFVLLACILLLWRSDLKAESGKARFFGPALSQFNKAIFLSNSGG